MCRNSIRKIVLSDAEQTGCVSDDIRKAKNLQEWRQLSENELRIIEDLKTSKVSVDKITIFSLRPPEFRSLFNTTRNYFRWFRRDDKKTKGDEINDTLSDSIYSSIWVDSLQFKVQLRFKALPEVLDYIESLSYSNEEEEEVYNMIELMKKIDYVMNICINELSTEDQQLLEFVNEHFIYDDKDIDHLPVPVFSYIKPTMGVQFLHHILLSMGQFSTEIDIVMQPTL